jgi:outer membrane protein
MRLFATFLIILLTLSRPLHAQDNGMGWSLQSCVRYAVAHNISIRQDSLSARLARYTLFQSQMNMLPTVNVNGGYGRNFGRSVNPTTNQFVDQSYNYISASGAVNELLFSWFSVRNTIEKNRFAMLAATADLDQLKDDVSLNVATGFLGAVLAGEQIHISENQVKLSKAQLDQTRAFAEAGRLPELNVAQLESQLASDSANLINSIASYNASVLDLKTLLNLDMAAPFSIALPQVEPDGMLDISALTPEDIFKVARQHFGSVKGSEYRVSSAEKGLNAAKGNLYPQFSISGQAGTNWASNYQKYTLSNQYAWLPSGVVGRTGDTVYQPQQLGSLSTMPLSQQMSNNFRQLLSFNVNVPLFNNWQAQYAVRQAQINLETQRLNKFNSELTLKQNVYKAHNNAVNSIEKFKAARRADDAARRALDFAKKRYDLGLTSTVDFLVTQNSAFVAASNLAIAKFDLVFKLKVIDYYLGKEIKL